MMDIRDVRQELTMQVDISVSLAVCRLCLDLVYLQMIRLPDRMHTLRSPGLRPCDERVV